jgi:hypothetical protein
MSNIFQEVKTNAQGVEQQLLGPDYPYWENIKSPSELGMSSTGNLETLGKDVSGLISYVEVLVSGTSDASKTNGMPLGNRFFLKTAGQCSPVTNARSIPVLDSNGDTVLDGNGNPIMDLSANPVLDADGNPVMQDRYVYIDNVPNGSIPFISSAMGVNFSNFRGLIPGAMGNMKILNPFTILQSFMEGSAPPCQQITLQTVGPTPPPTSLKANERGSETHYVALIDIGNMNACAFPTGTNPLTDKKCKEAFTSTNDNDNYYTPILIRDPITYFYFFSLGALLIYIIYCLTCRRRN